MVTNNGVQEWSSAFVQKKFRIERHGIEPPSVVARRSCDQPADAEGDRLGGGSEEDFGCVAGSFLTPFVRMTRVGASSGVPALDFGHHLAADEARFAAAWEPNFWQ